MKMICRYNGLQYSDKARTIGGLKGGWEPGFICVGVPIGSDSFVRAIMDRKLTELEDEVDKAAKVLGEERHSLWTVLRSSNLHKLDYWLGLIHPSLMRESA